ncbi:jg6642 [Pararge aegeria aegeria]|uniref:Jg6642 protein n=1 Tax=Pararge aegeria aegeria TaxID=348720 RepID=A0A8S4RSG8_9NEOP|nr:jg6642 [Pararge aegeria aegeria]
MSVTLGPPGDRYGDSVARRSLVLELKGIPRVPGLPSVVFSSIRSCYREVPASVGSADWVVVVCESVPMTQLPGDELEHRGVLVGKSPA